MAHMICECGNRLSNVSFPNELEGRLQGTYEYEYRKVWECDSCGRLQIDVKDEKGLTECKSYIPEDGKCGQLFRVGTTKEYFEKLKWDCRINKKELQAMLKNLEASYEEWLDAVEELTKAK